MVENIQDVHQQASDTCSRLDLVGLVSQSVNQLVQHWFTVTFYCFYWMWSMEYGVSKTIMGSPYDMIHIVNSPIILPAGLDDTYKSLADRLRGEAASGLFSDRVLNSSTLSLSH